MYNRRCTRSGICSFDFDYVIQNYGRRKAKLGSKTIQNEKQNIVQQIAITSYKSVDNVLESVNNNNSAVQTNIPLNTSLSKTDINIPEPTNFIYLCKTKYNSCPIVKIQEFDPIENQQIKRMYK